MEPLSPIAYLRAQLRFTVPEWSSLSGQDKEDLQRWAREEMTLLGIPIKV